MKREEAIKELERMKAAYDIHAESAEIEDFRIEFEKMAKSLDVAIAALRGPTREQVRMGRWIRELTPQKLSGRTISHCSKCWYHVFWPNEHTNFCPSCGTPMTDEAVDILMERLEALKDGTTD